MSQPEVDSSQSSLGKWNLAAAIIIILGAAVRIRSYLATAPLWGDEAALALNILNRDYAGLLGPLNYRQMAPPIYLWSLNACESAFGIEELSLRLPALLAGIAALPLFRWLFRRLLPTGFALIALVFVAGASPLINYSVEVKQYSFDVFWTIALLCLTELWRDDLLRPHRMLAFALIGTFAIWASFPAFLTLGGIGVALTGFALYDRNVRQLVATISLGVIWVLSFAGLWKLQHPPSELMEHMNRYWERWMFPETITPTAIIRWLNTIVVELSTYIVPGYLPWIACPLIAIGAYRLFFTHRRTALTIFSIHSILFLAACLRQYPLGQRLCLFLLPYSYLFLSSGVSVLWGSLYPKVSLRHALAICLLVPLSIGPAWGFYKFATAHSLLPPNARTVLETLVKEADDDDLVYIHPKAGVVYEYYARLPGLARLAVLREKYRNRIRNTQALGNDFRIEKQDRRIWLLFIRAIDEDLAVLGDLPKNAKVTLRTAGGNAYLYEVQLPLQH